VQTSLLQAQVFMLDFQAARWLMNGEVPGQAGNDHPTSAPTGVFPTADGHINLAVGGGAMWRRFVELLGDPRLKAPEFADEQTRRANRAALNAVIGEHTTADTSAGWLARFTAAEIPCGEINTIDQVFAAPQVRHLGLARDFVSQERGPSRLVGQPIIMSDAESRIQRPPPLLGQHTAEVLGDLGYDASALAALGAEGVI
jgi:crotonobetainyl-CoA:carnitine CoA-transferase CaiB-like acyl-CoA transferase